MGFMNHETRITQLERELDEVKQQLKLLLKAEGKWMSLSEAEKKFDVSQWVLRRCIKDGTLVRLKDWKKNGNRYLVNQNSIKKIQ